ncbi:MAG: ATP-binding cassette, subfamily heavy metal transporter [Gammaproteobacteria bacterium]|nr:ATP-binding cassette, subfamily heavy metal transporter [Gammaproteobacteria bacterium]
MQAFRKNTAHLREVIALIWTDATGFVRFRLMVALLLIMIASAMTALGPVALKLVVDGFTGQAGAAGTSAVVLIGLYVLSQWVARTAGEIRGLVYARAERRMSRMLSERLFAHVMRLPLKFHLDRQTGAISQTLDNGLNGYQMVLHTLVFTILPVATELGTVVVVLSRLDHPAFLGLFSGAIVAYGVVFWYSAVTIMAAAHAASDSQVNATAVMTDSILNYETVKYFTAESVVQQRVSRALIQTEDGWVGFFRRYAYNGLFIATIFAGFLAVTILYAAREVHSGRMTVGTFVLVNTYMLQIVRPVEQLGYAMQMLSQGLAFLGKLFEIFREQPEVAAGVEDSAPGGAGRLEFAQVAVAYRSDRVILTDINFTLPAGKTLGIVGGSGSGKSTLVRLLVRLIDPDAGRILLDGVPVRELPLGWLRQAIAVVPQDTVLFNDTIGYNIAFGKEGSTQAEVEHVARLAHLHDFIMSLPDGYDTKVGERGVKLSGGEKQRVSIARAAIKRPRIYVFDEATSSLDSNTEREILKNLREISRFSTTVVIAHRLSTVVHADEIVVLDGGTIVERGTHSTLLRQHGRYAALWEAQQQGTVAA